MKFRHGDVGLKPCKAPAMKGRVRLDHNRLAEGEVTGHSHRLICAKSEFREVERTRPLTGEPYSVIYPIDGREVEADAYLYEVNGIVYLKINKRTALVHEDHGAEFLSRGTYRRILQREWSPEGERRVID